VSYRAQNKTRLDIRPDDRHQHYPNQLHREDARPIRMTEMHPVATADESSFVQRDG
jgi:hypothetical protein